MGGLPIGLSSLPPAELESSTRGAIGAAGALTLGGVLGGVLYGIAPRDPATIALVGTALLLIAALASWVPARRAAGVDPAVTLRDE